MYTRYFNEELIYILKVKIYILENPVKKDLLEEVFLEFAFMRLLAMSCMNTWCCEEGNIRVSFYYPIHLPFVGNEDDRAPTIIFNHHSII